MEKYKQQQQQFDKKSQIQSSIFDPVLLDTIVYNGDCIDSNVTYSMAGWTNWRTYYVATTCIDPFETKGGLYVNMW